MLSDEEATVCLVFCLYVFINSNVFSAVSSIIFLVHCKIFFFLML